MNTLKRNNDRMAWFSCSVCGLRVYKHRINTHEHQQQNTNDAQQLINESEGLTLEEQTELNIKKVVGR